MKTLNPNLTEVKKNYPFDLKARTREEMAILLGMSLSSFKRELRKIKFNNGGKQITPRQQIWIINEMNWL